MEQTRGPGASLPEQLRALHGRQPGHAVILSGEGDKLETARYLAAAWQCRAADKPCLTCNACRKVLAGIHPDVITAEDPDHKLLPVELLRRLTADAAILPNEGERKVYLFPDCRRLDARGQDILLKTVEEGPAYAAFVFCTENSAALLPTLRSRCTEWKLYAPTQALTPTQGAEEFCRALGKKSVSALAAHVTALEGRKPSREELSALLAELWSLCVDAMKLHRGGQLSPTRQTCAGILAEAYSVRQLNRLAELLRESRRACEMNVGVGLLLGGLAAEWEEFL